MNTNLNPSMGYHFPDQQSHANLQNNMWYNNQPRITGQLFNQNQGFHNPNSSLLIVGYVHTGPNHFSLLLFQTEQYNLPNQ
jgi:hypothetical protein